MRIKKKIMDMLPASTLAKYRLQKEKYRNFKLDRQMKSVVKKDFIYDYNRYIKFAAYQQLDTKEKLAAFLIREYHAVEKGLSLKNVKIGFGIDRISNLIDKFNIYLERYNRDYVTDISISCFKAYLEFDEKHNNNINPIRSKLVATIEKYQFDDIDHTKGGTKILNKTDILSTLHFDYQAFFKSRHSTRDFTDEPVDRLIITDAISLARFTPSVCNRQAWRVFMIDGANRPLMDKFLSVQNGNKGFGQHISTLLVITGKLSSFFSFERNQVFIDGGMFAMSVVLALHAKGLGVCCLNTSYSAESHEAFNQVMPLDDDIVPIMFIGIGHLKDSYKVAVSERKPLEEILQIL